MSELEQQHPIVEPSKEAPYLNGVRILATCLEYLSSEQKDHLYSSMRGHFYQPVRALTLSMIVDTTLNDEQRALPSIATIIQHLEQKFPGVQITATFYHVVKE